MVSHAAIGKMATQSFQPQWTSLMHRLPVLCLLALSVLAQDTAFAQSGRSQDGAAPPASAGKSAEDMKAIKERVADWLKTCLTDWDRATHMTTKEWRVTCQRVASERGKFLLETPNAMSIGTKGRQR
jgi:hypothetical protein